MHQSLNRHIGNNITIGLELRIRKFAMISLWKEGNRLPVSLGERVMPKIGTSKAVVIGLEKDDYRLPASLGEEVLTRLGGSNMANTFSEGTSFGERYLSGDKI